MKVVEELIRTEADGSLSFGNYALDEKQKLSDYKYESDLYKVKTFKEITKLEKNETFVYESVPGSSVFNYTCTENAISFAVTGNSDIQITLEVEPENEFEVEIDGVRLGKMASNLGGKLVISVEAREDNPTQVKIRNAK